MNAAKSSQSVTYRRTVLTKTISNHKLYTVTLTSLSNLANLETQTSTKFL
jgi:hypothetical protein